MTSVSKDVTGWAGVWQTQLLGGLAVFIKEDLFYLFIFELTKISLSGSKMPASIYE